MERALLRCRTTPRQFCVQIRGSTPLWKGKKLFTKSFKILQLDRFFRIFARRRFAALFVNLGESFATGCPLSTTTFSRLCTLSASGTNFSISTNHCGMLFRNSDIAFGHLYTPVRFWLSLPRVRCKESYGRGLLTSTPANSSHTRARGIQTFENLMM